MGPLPMEKFGAGNLQKSSSVGVCPRKITPIKGYTTTYEFLEKQVRKANISSTTCLANKMEDYIVLS